MTVDTSKAYLAQLTSITRGMLTKQHLPRLPLSTYHIRNLRYDGAPTRHTAVDQLVDIGVGMFVVEFNYPSL
ncbi:cytochrome p450 [Moniliophthora roreri]|nr:cytochrome p450 [Moniliophthora roreri]